VDSHHALPVVGHDRARLDAVEWAPFRAAIAADVASLMTGHLMVPALDADRRATFSSRVVTDELKHGLGFNGVVFSDDMGMKAATGDISLPEASVAAIQAGCDAVLLCNSTVDEQWAAIEALIRACERDDIPQTRVDDAFARQRRMKERFAASTTSPSSLTSPVPPLDRVGCEDHQIVAREMAAWA
jgi:beta-N-acetylhexosaminidase